MAPDIGSPITPAGEDRNAGPFPDFLIECAMCHRSFPSGISVDSGPLEASDSPRQIHECPFCGFTSAYSAKDYGQCRG